MDMIECCFTSRRRCCFIAILIQFVHIRGTILLITLIDYNINCTSGMKWLLIAFCSSTSPVILEIPSRRAIHHRSKEIVSQFVHQFLRHYLWFCRCHWFDFLVVFASLFNTNLLRKREFQYFFLLIFFAEYLINFLRCFFSSLKSKLQTLETTNAAISMNAWMEYSHVDIISLINFLCSINSFAFFGRR